MRERDIAKALVVRQRQTSHKLPDYRFGRTLPSAVSSTSHNDISDIAYSSPALATVVGQRYQDVDLRARRESFRQLERAPLKSHECMEADSGAFAQVTIDGKGHLMGRLASTVAKQLLSGQKIVVVRCEAINISGGFYRAKCASINPHTERGYLSGSEA